MSFLHCAVFVRPFWRDITYTPLFLWWTRSIYRNIYIEPWLQATAKFQLNCWKLQKYRQKDGRTGKPDKPDKQDLESSNFDWFDLYNKQFTSLLTTQNKTIYNTNDYEKEGIQIKAVATTICQYQL